jgi:hypothetical protein
MADLNVGDRCPSALDQSYSLYRAWCEALGYRAASYEAWLRCERVGYGTPKATGRMGAMLSHSESQRRVKQPPTLPAHCPQTAL